MKRAQIAAADLALAGIAPADDLPELTLFADNLVPHVLRIDGVLEFYLNAHLLVVLQRLRRAGVDHEAHVRPVDAHPERDGRDHDVRVLVDERVLVAMALRDRRARRGTAAARSPVVDSQSAQRVDFLAGGAVDDAGVAAMPRRGSPAAASSASPRGRTR